MPRRSSSPVVHHAFVALLRGVNVGGNKKVPMKELAALASRLGYEDVATYIASGNLVFRAAGTPSGIEAALEGAIAEAFGFEVEVIVREGSQWAAFATTSPFPEAELERPNLVLLGVPKKPLATDAIAKLTPYAAPGERVAVRDGALYFDFANGSARSKMTPAVIDRAAGSTVTTRNVRTVAAIAELVAARTKP